MSEFKNPFTPGDIIWWERRGVPIAFYFVSNNDTICGLDGILTRSMEDVVRNYKIIRDVRGPFRLTGAENWSDYKFGIWESHL